MNNFCQRVKRWWLRAVTAGLLAVALGITGLSGWVVCQCEHGERVCGEGRMAEGPAVERACEDWVLSVGVAAQVQVEVTEHAALTAAREPMCWPEVRRGEPGGVILRGARAPPALARSALLRRWPRMYLRS
ncbi:MAG: hypothetical protein ACI4RT_00275 [Candidatus Spyradenecus sp.]